MPPLSTQDVGGGKHRSRLNSRRLQMKAAPAEPVGVYVSACPVGVCASEYRARTLKREPQLRRQPRHKLSLQRKPRLDYGSVAVAVPSTQKGSGVDFAMMSVRTADRSAGEIDSRPLSRRSTPFQTVIRGPHRGGVGRLVAIRDAALERAPPRAKGDCRDDRSSRRSRSRSAAMAHRSGEVASPAIAARIP